MNLAIHPIKKRFLHNEAIQMQYKMEVVGSQGATFGSRMAFFEYEGTLKVLRLALECVQANCAADQGTGSYWPNCGGSAVRGWAHVATKLLEGR